MGYLKDLKDLVRENVSETEIMEACESGKLTGIRIESRAENPDLVDVFETYSLMSVLGQSEPEESLVYEELDRNTAAYYVMEDFTVEHCLTLLNLYTDLLITPLIDNIRFSKSDQTGAMNL